MMSRKKTSFICPKDLRFHCSRCALCCGDTQGRTRHVLLSKKDAEIISCAFSIPVESFAKEVEGIGPYVYEMKKTGSDGKCIYLQGKDCGIYELRPLVCRFYPFELIASKNGRYKFHCTQECPGIGNGKKLDRSYFVTLFNRARRQL